MVRLGIDKVIITKMWNISRILNVTFLRKFKRPTSCFQIEVFSLLFLFISSLFIMFHSRFQAFIQALLAVIVFGIKIEFSDKCLQLSDKRSCSWLSRGCCNPPPLEGFGAKRHKFSDFVHFKPSQMRFEWPQGDNFL